jgi:geranylgeranyl pyrophosphate synthase
LGKPAGNDFCRGLITLPVLCYLEEAEDAGPVQAVLSGQRGQEHVRAAIEAICSSGAIETSLAEAQAHAGRSQEALAILPDNASRQILCSLAEYVVERRH